MTESLTITPDEAEMIAHLVEQGIEDFEARVKSDPRAIPERVGLRHARHSHADALTVAQLIAAKVRSQREGFHVNVATF